MGNKKILLLTILALLAVFFVRSGSLQNKGNAKDQKTYRLESLQSDVQEVVEQYDSIVVSIVATKDVPVIRNCSFEEDSSLFDVPFFGEPERQRRCTVESREVEMSGGTGFAIDSRGVILTNKHVVDDNQAQYMVLFNDGKEEKVTRIYRDTNTDAALLRVDRRISQSAKLGDSNTLKVGQFVIAIGNALGEFENSASFGIVSGLERSIMARDASGGNIQELNKVIQIDAAVNPGNSGGPLINLNGEVVAINAARAQADNIGFAIPINDIKPVLARFLQ